MESKFLTPLVGEWIDDETFCLHEEFKYQSEILGGTVTAPKGFEILTMPKGYCTDFASVPRWIPFVYDAFGDRAHHESVVHDYLYQRHVVVINRPDGTSFNLLVSRLMADRVFKEAMIVRKKPMWIVNGMYLGVRLGGWNSYRTGPNRCRILNPEPAPKDSRNVSKKPHS